MGNRLINRRIWSGCLSAAQGPMKGPCRLAIPLFDSVSILIYDQCAGETAQTRLQATFRRIQCPTYRAGPAYRALLAGLDVELDGTNSVLGHTEYRGEQFRTSHPMTAANHMPSNAREIDEQHFLQGVSSAKAGLAEETCPYEYVADNSETSITEICAPVNWRQGWQYGKFVAIQRARVEKAQEIQNSIAELFRFEGPHCEQCEILNRGLMKSGLKYFSTQKESSKLADQIQMSKEFRLLKDLYIELYLPWRPEENPYKFKIFDRLLDIFGSGGDKERTLRDLVKRYGERHGVRAAWCKYVHTESVELLAQNRVK